LGRESSFTLGYVSARNRSFCSEILRWGFRFETFRRRGDEGSEFGSVFGFGFGFGFGFFI
jgi:hypothetical protein